MTFSAEERFGRRLVATLGRTPELPPDVLTRLAFSRRVAVGRHAAQVATEARGQGSAVLKLRGSRRGYALLFALVATTLAVGTWSLQGERASDSSTTASAWLYHAQADTNTNPLPDVLE